MKKLFLALLLGATTLSSFAQVTDKEKAVRAQSKDTLDGWNLGGMISITGAQSTFTNWNAGGVNSIALNGLLNYHANLKKGNATWENNFTVGYGLIRQGNKNASWIKSDDRLNFYSKYGQKASEHWYYAGLMDFMTQMTPGYNYPNDSVVISRFMAPGYLLSAIGMDYKPSKSFSMFVAPITGKYTFVNDDTLANAGAFGVDPAEFDAFGTMITPGKKFRAELGGYLKLRYEQKFPLNEEKERQNISFSTSLSLFSNYLNNPERIDVNWDVFAQVQLWKKITLTLATNLIYDDDVNIAVDEDGDGTDDAFGPRLQFKQVFGIGITYEF